MLKIMTLIKGFTHHNTVPFLESLNRISIDGGSILVEVSGDVSGIIKKRN